VERPKTRYAKLDDLHVAYQVVGKGPPDIVLVAPYIMHVEAVWELPYMAPYLRGLARIGRLVIFDAIGSGLSDPLPGRKRTIDYWTNDAHAVMDAVGVTRATIHGYDSAGAGAMLFAATYPERVSSLILVNTFARALWAEDHPRGLPPETRDAFIDDYQAEWGAGTLLRRYMPTADLSAEDIERHAWYERQVASPGVVRTQMNVILDTDVREVLPLIQAPTLVVHRTDNKTIPVELGRDLAARIPGARYVELPGDEHVLYGRDGEVLLGEIREFVTGVREAPVTDRVLATILFTDIVGSTQRAAELGDQRWRELLDEHDAVVRTGVARFQGKLIKTTGDGALATFDGPTRAIEAARTIARAARGLDLQIRAGLHTGECELRGEDVGGIAVHIASRIAGLASAGEVVVSRTVKDLAVGSGIEFMDRGVHTLKGVPDAWRLFTATRSSRDSDC
jgi:class 3 adenylate cyclase